MGPYKPLLLGWWLYPLLYGNNGSLDPIAHVFREICQMFLSKIPQIQKGPFLSPQKINIVSDWWWDRDTPKL